MSERGQYEIQRIMDGLTSARRKGDWGRDIEIIWDICQNGGIGVDWS